MGGILAAIENSTTAVVECGKMNWRVRKVSSADLARVGHAALAVAQHLENPNSDGTPKKGKKDDDKELVAKLTNSSSKHLETMARLKDAIVAAGLLAVGDPLSGEWEDVRCVMDVKDADAQNGKLWVGALPSNVADACFEEIMSLSTDGGAALERLQAFRESARSASRNPSGRKNVRKASK